MVDWLIALLALPGGRPCQAGNLAKWAVFNSFNPSRTASAPCKRKCFVGAIG